MDDDAPQNDSKLVQKITDNVKGQLSLWVIAGLLSVVGLMVVAAWRDLQERVTRIEALVDTRATLIDNQRKADLAALQQLISEHIAELRPLRDRMATVETTATRNTAWIDRNAERLMQISSDLAAIRARLARSDRDRDDERPAPPVDLGRVPMLWHF